MILESNAEIHAEKATKLRAFPVNLPEVRRVVKEVLTQFGSNLIFREYTTHDITHIDDMLATVDWIIPEKTKALMTPGDWLMLVLSIYFHDMGLVVTETEFKERSKTGFHDFCNDILYSGVGGDDYRAKVSAMKDDHGERLLYQEFVRHHHATRIKVWLAGDTCPELGYCTAQIKLIEDLLYPLGIEFREGLALVCESHNLDDIEDTKKYRQDHPYGNSADEEINLQYVSALLRTIDLIQITNRRAPSTLYRLIDPSDPISQLEWAKQNAVTRVRSQVQKDEEGVALASTQPDTVEIFAQFENETSFFGLSAYLRYANDQIKSTFQAIEKTKKSCPKDYSFPWKKIDDTNVVAVGFEKEPFGFEIDQEKILDLLTGHTLYNDSRVVVRELTQNAIDAVRLQHLNQSGGPEAHGEITISWDSENSELTITDNGTGMSQSTIENHLLKVGSSKYQDPKFKESFPNFTPISRFGIGVLTAFMVADKVEITTVSPDDLKARRISLRSVHGKYLIKLLDKSASEIKDAIGSHGSKFVLRFRASANKMSIQKTLESYVLFPRCKVALSIDEEKSISIGYKSPKLALENYLATKGTIKRFREESTAVHEISDNGITIAYAMAYSSHYKDWQFVLVDETPTRRNKDDIQAPILTCVEGIAVQDNIVGGVDRNLLALINMTGEKAPRTNVARSALETTDEFDNSVSTVNRLLLDAVEIESKRLVDKEGYSLTWAIEQMPYLMHPIVSRRGENELTRITNLKNKELCKTRMFLVEADGKRTAMTGNELKEKKVFWTVESMLLRSTEQFIRESKREVARSSLLKLVYGDEDNSLDDILVVPNIGNSYICGSVIKDIFDIAHFQGRINERRLDARWELKSDKWLSLNDIFKALMDATGYREYELYTHMLERTLQARSISRLDALLIPMKYDEVTSDGLDDFHAVKTLESAYFLPNNSFTDFFRTAPEHWMEDIKFMKTAFFSMLIATHSMQSYKDVSKSSSALLSALPQEITASSEAEIESSRALWSETTRIKIYDPFGWEQRSIGDM